MEAIPGCAGNFSELRGWVHFQVEQHQWQIAVAQDDVGGFECFGGVFATDPEKARQGFLIEGAWVEGIGGVDKDDDLLRGVGLLNERMQQETAAGGRFCSTISVMEPFAKPPPIK